MNSQKLEIQKGTPLDKVWNNKKDSFWGKEVIIKTHIIMLVFPNGEYWQLIVPKELSEQELWKNIEEQFYKMNEQELKKEQSK